MASEKLDFTRARLDAIPTPDKRRYYKDSKSKGLMLAVLPSGTKSFELYRKVDGRPKRIGLGHFDSKMAESRSIPKGSNPLILVGNSSALNVAMARLLAAAVSAQLDMGINPSELKHSTRKEKLTELTLEGAFDSYEKDYLLPQEKRTTQDLRNLFERHLGNVKSEQKKPHGKEKTKSAYGVDWSKRKLSDITAEEVRTLHNRLKEGGGIHTSNRVFELLRAIFNKMEEWDKFKGKSPCKGISKFKEQSRERFITSEELPRIFDALINTQNETFVEFVLLSLFTGARRENVLSMRWQDFNFEASYWTVPSELSKNGSPLILSLSTKAIKILQERKLRVGTENAFVFPARSKSGYMSAPKKQWAKLLEDAEISNLHLHDLRRTLGSWAAMTGASLQIIGAALGHKSTEATKVYARLQDSTVKSAIDLAAETMLEKAGIKSVSKTDVE